MNHNDHTEPQNSIVPWAVACALAILCLAGWLLGVGTGLTAEEGQTDALVILSRFLHALLLPFCVAAVIFLAGASVGSALLRLLRIAPRGAFVRLLFATAIGLGVSSYATLALGTLGLLSGEVFWALTAGLLLAGCRPLAETLRDTARRGREWLSSWGPFEWAVALGGAALLVVAVLCARTPVLEYDTLEYHLGGPAEHFAAGRVRFLWHNVYACFPAQVQMLYLQGMVLGGGKLTGMAVAILIQVLFGALAAAGVGAIAARHVRKEAGLLAGVFFLTCPILIVTALGHALDTLSRCFYYTVALLAVMEWMFGREESAPGRRSYLVLGGLCCGLAVAVKYTALLLLCLPLGAAVLLVSCVRHKGWYHKLTAPAILAGCALLALLPWLIRNLVATGNPVFPLLYHMFGAEGWSAQQAAKFARAHAAVPFSAGKLLQETWRFLCGYSRTISAGYVGPLGLMFVPLLLVALLRAEDGPKMGGQSRLNPWPILLLICCGAAMVVLWGVATHQIARFLTPLLVVLCPLSAAGFCVAAGGRVAGKLCRAAVLLGVAYAVYFCATTAYMWGGLGGSLRGEGLPELVRARDWPRMSAYSDAVEWVNDLNNVPPDARVMLVGEARTFYFDRPLLYSTVFNDPPIEPALELARDDLPRAVARLRETGATYVLVNWVEFARLATTYSYTYEGRERQGYLPQVNLATRQPLLDLLNAAGRQVKTFGEAHLRPDSSQTIPIIEIYELPP